MISLDHLIPVTFIIVVVSSLMLEALKIEVNHNPVAIALLHAAVTGVITALVLFLLFVSRLNAPW